MIVQTGDPLADFHLVQYEALRGEIESCVQEIRTIERYALIGTGIVWAWLATNAQLEIPYIIWWVPLLFSLSGWLRTIALATSVRRLARYLREVEEDFFCGARVQGWETYKWNNVRPSIKLSVYTFWVVLSIATIVIPLAVKVRPHEVRKEIQTESSHPSPSPSPTA